MPVFRTTSGWSGWFSTLTVIVMNSSGLSSLAQIVTRRFPRLFGYSDLAKLHIGNVHEEASGGYDVAA